MKVKNDLEVYSEIKVGSRVLCCFTNNYNIISFEGEVTKINETNIRVKSLKDGVNGWDKGHNFPISTPNSAYFSINNRIMEVLK